MIRIVCSAIDPGDALTAATALRDRIHPPGTSVLGPAPLFRLRGKARSQLVLKSTERRASIAAVGAAVEAVGPDAAKRGVSVSVDVDPQ